MSTSSVVRPVRRARHALYPLRVARVDRLCDDAAAITFAVPGDLTDVLAHRPGQWLTVRRQVDGRDERRSYSICAPAGAPLRIGVREVPGGALSSWLVRDVRAGDLLEVTAPAGVFTPDLDMPGRHVLIAAGSGITPVLSIAASMLAVAGSDVTLLYGNRRVSTIMFADELADLKDRYPAHLATFHVLSREAQEVELFTGRLDGARLRRLLPLVSDDVMSVDGWWLCGPHAMVEEATDVLREAGVDPQRVHRELFYVEPEPPPPRHGAAAPDHAPDTRDGASATSVVDVVLDGRTTTVMVSRDVALLDGAQTARPDLPFACKGGVCGTCRARVVEGEVRMRRNFALEPAELADGFVLTCQSLCVSERVVVDFDA